MKRCIALGLVAACTLLLAACGSKEASSKAESKVAEVSSAAVSEEVSSVAQADAGFFELTEKDGVLEYVDTEKSPFEDCGIHTVVDKAAKTVTFTKTDGEGTDTVEYLQFSPEKNEVEKYYYVSMMGTGFYYYYDLEAGEMVRIEDKDHQDTTESAKGNGRFDGPAEEMKAEVEALESYFETNFGFTIADAVAGV